jgi:hypothetical protein
MGSAAPRSGSVRYCVIWGCTLLAHNWPWFVAVTRCCPPRTSAVPRPHTPPPTTAPRCRALANLRPVTPPPWRPVLHSVVAGARRCSCDTFCGRPRLRSPGPPGTALPRPHHTCKRIFPNASARPRVWPPPPSLASPRCCCSERVARCEVQTATQEHTATREQTATSSLIIAARVFERHGESRGFRASAHFPCPATARE